MSYIILDFKDIIKKNPLVFLVVLIQILIYTAPYMYGLYHQNENMFFTGQFIPKNKVTDFCGNCFYIAQGFKQSYDGAILLEDKFQGFDTYPKIIHPWWTLGGHMARWMCMDLSVFNLLQRLIWSILASLTVYIFSKGLFKDQWYAFIAVLLFNFSSVAISYPNGPEYTVFMANVLGVVLPLAYFLLALFHYLMYKMIQGKPNIALLSIVAFLLTASYPYAIVSLSVSVFIFFLYLLISKQKNFKNLLLIYLAIFIPAFIMTAYDFYLVITDARLVDSQAKVVSVSLKILLISYLPFTLLAFFFALKLLLSNPKEMNKRFWVYLYCIILSSLILTQVPTKILPFSMQMIVGIQLPLIIIALEFIRKYLRMRWLRYTFLFILLGSSWHSFDVYYKVFMSIKDYDRPNYIDKNIYTALMWMDSNTDKTQVLLCMPDWSPFAGMYAGNRLYIGQNDLFTPDWQKRMDYLTEILASGNEKSIYSFLKEENIDYIFYDDKMKAIDLEQRLPKMGNVQYKNELVTILEL